MSFENTTEKIENIDETLDKHLDGELIDAKNRFFNKVKNRLTAAALLGMIAMGTGCDGQIEMMRYSRINKQTQEQINHPEENFEEMYTNYLSQHPELKPDDKSLENFKYNFREWNTWWSTYMALSTVISSQNILHRHSKGGRLHPDEDAYGRTRAYNWLDYQKKDLLKERLVILPPTNVHKIVITPDTKSITITIDEQQK